MKKSVLSVLMVLCSVLVYAQTGTIRGQVIEEATGETLIGATVRVEGTSTGATTDLDGNYTIKVAPGTYNLKISFVSFVSQVINGVEVQAGEVTLVPTVGLSDAATELQEVVVQATALRDTESALLTAQRKSANMMDAISSQTFSRTGDGDVGAAMKRVTGVSVEGGKYVYVRGLGDRYSKTNLNGAEIPGLDPNRNSVQLDLFPTNLINNIIVYKTFSPNLPGSFVGGYVDVETKDFPEERTFSFSSSLGYNSQATFNNNFLTYEGGSYDFLGFDDGTRQLPNLIDLQDREAVPARSFTNGLQAKRLTKVTDAFNKNWTTQRQPAPLNQSMSVSYGDQKEIFGKPVGFLGSLSYSRSFDSYEDGIYGRYSLTGSVENTNTLNQNIYLNDHHSQENVLWGAMLGGSVKLNNFNKIGITAIHNQNGTTSARELAGVKPSDAGNLRFFTTALMYEQRSLSSAQLKGEHAFGAGEGLKVNWISSYTLSAMDQPDLRFFTYGDYGAESRGLRIEPSIGQPPTRYSRSMDELNFDNKLDFTLPYKQWNGQDAKLQFGGAYVWKDRIFNEYQYRFDSDRTTYEGDPVAHVSNIWTRENTGGVFVYDAYDPRNNYQASQSVAAAYMMTDLPVTSKLRAIVGTRVEKTELNFTSDAANVPELKDQFGDLKNKSLLDNLDVLPSLNLTYQLQENMNLRAAYGRTLARPSFRELAPYQSFDFVGGYNYVGNDTLSRTLVDNVDLRWEFFTKPTELFSVSAFYKRFENPIEATFIPLSQNPLLTWRNVSEAMIYGIELEARKNLGFISEGLSPLSVGANITLVQSSVAIAEAELQRKRNFNPELDATRQMAGQSPYIINANIAYASEKTEVNLVFNVQGTRLSIVSPDATPDVYEKPVPGLNFNVSRRFANRWKAKLNATNILNPQVKFVHEYKGEEYIFQQYTRGREVSLGVSYSLF
jgi:outer membrane receptor protein involved in Fe transport